MGGEPLAHTSRFTKSSALLATVSQSITSDAHVSQHVFLDIAQVGKKVVDFYKKKGGEVISPLVKAF